MNNEEKIFIKMVKTLRKPEKWLEYFNEEYNVSQFLDICNNYKVIVILHDFYSKFLPDAVVNKLAKQKSSLIEESKLKFNLFLEVFDKFRNNNIDCILVKSAITSYFAYGNPFVRTYNDIDIIVDGKYIPEAYKLMQELDYKQILKSGNVNRHDGDEPILEFRHDFHEYEMIRDNHSIELATSISSIPTRIMNEMINHTQILELYNVKIKSLDEIHTSICFFMNCFQDLVPFLGLNHSSIVVHYNFKLQHIFDIVNFVERNNIDWKEIYQTAKSYKLEGYIWGVLERVSKFIDEFKNPLHSFFTDIQREEILREVSFFSNYRYIYTDELSLDNYFNIDQEVEDSIILSIKNIFYSDTNPKFRDNNLNNEWNEEIVDNERNINLDLKITRENENLFFKIQNNAPLRKYTIVFYYIKPFHETGLATTFCLEIDGNDCTTNNEMLRIENTSFEKEHNIFFSIPIDYFNEHNSHFCFLFSYGRYINNDIPQRLVTSNICISNKASTQSLA